MCCNDPFLSKLPRKRIDLVHLGNMRKKERGHRTRQIVDRETGFFLCCFYEKWQIFSSVLPVTQTNKACLAKLKQYEFVMSMNFTEHP